jgi:hypothetical protein
MMDSNHVSALIKTIILEKEQNIIATEKFTVKELCETPLQKGHRHAEKVKVFKLVQKNNSISTQKKLKSMIIDIPKAVLYVAGEKLLLGWDLKEHSRYSVLKTSNA